MERITLQMLEARVLALNELSGSPLRAYEEKPMPDGPNRDIPQHGPYYVACAYGGYRLERISGRGAEDISARGPKRYVWDYLGAYIKGWYAAERTRRNKIAGLNPRSEFAATKQAGDE